jgi:hypothetical protein
MSSTDGCTLFLATMPDPVRMQASVFFTGKIYRFRSMLCDQVFYQADVMLCGPACNNLHPPTYLGPSSATSQTVIALRRELGNKYLFHSATSYSLISFSVLKNEIIRYDAADHVFSALSQDLQEPESWLRALLANFSTMDDTEHTYSPETDCTVRTWLVSGSLMEDYFNLQRNDKLQPKCASLESNNPEKP